METKLKNSYRRFGEIFENSLAVMLLIDPETHRIIAANNAAENYYGWSKLQFEKMLISDINTLSPAEIKVEIEKARLSERIYYRVKHRLASGEVRNVDVYNGKVEIDGKEYLHSIIHDVTEQAMAEESLKNNERILSLFVEHSPASIAMFDTEMRYLVYSRRFLTDYDLDKRNITGLSHYEVFPEIPQRWKEIHQRCLKGEILSADNDPFPRANGKLDWIRWEIHPWFKNDNEVGGLILFSEVITERKNSIEAIRESEAYNRMLFEQSQIGLALSDMDGKLVDINPAFAAIMGRTIEEVKSLSYWDITPGKYASQEHRQLELINKTGRYGPYEKEYLHKDGHLVPVRLQGLMIEREGKKYIWSNVENISEQKKAEAKLKESEARYRNILEVAPVGIAIHQNEKIVFVNPSFLQIIGAQNAEQLIGNNFNSIIHSDDLQNSTERIQRLINGEKGLFPIDYKYVRMDGVVIDVEVMATLLTYKNKPAVQVIISDITERKRLHLELEDLNAELEERVRQRTEQLHAANKELETFTYSVSHDLKAPLRGIDGYSKLLLDEYGSSMNEEAIHFIKTIRSSTLQMNLLIEDLLSYSRLERIHFKKEEIALKSFMDALVSSFDEEITKGGFQVKMNIPEVNIVADSTGLSIALRNILENAIKFTRQVPEPKMEIDLYQKPDSWIIAVKDNGIGFDMKYHDRIFDIFQRLHRPEDFPGTGIGLAMVAKALQRMKGKAWAESTPGEGSTFCIEILKTNV